MASNDTIRKTLLVSVLLCVVCSVVVSGADVAQLFENVAVRVVDMRSGRFTEDVDSEGYDPIAAAGDPDQSQPLSSDMDIAKVRNRENFGLVYLVGDSERPDRVILPVRGAGLWGEMRGFLALEGDMNTVAGIGFYEHKETPGLGGEVDNPRWKSLWPGKRAFRDGDVAIEVLKGFADRNGPKADYQIDGLSGATLTTRGVHNLVQFWLGDNGFGPFLANLKAGEA